MSEQPAAYGGERPASEHRRVLERFKRTDPEAYEVLFGENALPRTTDALVDRIAIAEARAEAAEAALLETWVYEWQDGYHMRCGFCELGAVTTREQIEHTPDCIIPDLIERHASGSDSAESVS